jgi:hypothetical protein
MEVYRLIPLAGTLVSMLMYLSSLPALLANNNKLEGELPLL